MKKLLLVIQSATNVAEYSDQVLADGKISLSEGLGLITKLSDLQNLITEGKAAVKEYLALDNNGREEAIKYLADELNLHNHEVDAKVDATLMHLSHMESAVRNMVTAITGIKNTWA